jgi:hypothetical protein
MSKNTLEPLIHAVVIVGMFAVGVIAGSPKKARHATANCVQVRP